MTRPSVVSSPSIDVFLIICSFQGTIIETDNCLSGGKGIRTLDPLLARQVLSQLSYTPKI